MRVAVVQFATSSNVQENLASCIRMINQAAQCKPSLIVLPEFCNTLFSNVLVPYVPQSKTQFDKSLTCYANHDQAWHEALTIEGPFLQAIAEQAKQHNCYIVINVTLRRNISSNLPDNDSGGLASSNSEPNTKSNISITSCLYCPLGKLIHQEDKQNLVGSEKEYFISTSKVSEVIATPIGKLGLLSDTMSFDPARKLAFSGAQLLCNSINSFALDQSHLHDPARACENNVFFATANKVGSLLSTEQMLEQSQAIAETQDLMLEDELFSTRVGAGQSQIVAANGRVLAKLDNKQEGFIFADIDLSVTQTAASPETEVEITVGLNNKFRPDGTQLIKQLRPELYQRLKASIKHTFQNTFMKVENVPVTANVAIFATYKSNEQAIEDVCHYIENNLTDIIQLPELFFIADKTITNDVKQREQIANLSEQLIKQVSAVLRPFQYLCTSLIIEGVHQAVLISEQGLLATQQQLHFCQRYQWTELGEKLNIIELPLEQGRINLAMLTADDANIAEIVQIAALHGCHLLLVPFDIQEPCEVAYNLIARAAENRICIVAASREKSFVPELPAANTKNNIYHKNKVKAQKSTGLIANLSTEPELLPQWKTQKFNGYINQPLVKLQYGKITKAVIHPIAACTK
ncbi:nitrilase-related carbon-nitrogen hydrolase [Colwellia psychrerythraea]|uniref:Nitrilase/cyanide hydratase and apolipoprotein N-acyltransferase n=1 Tax=Colwellia psychrerythraea TaxID=28229 RepID=A0A099KT68_COLPS|nr:nitrilase-related carbon-nitrogen hydrolase [Colwellia psychrerythraea]KGJ93964.1 Nitrilase/cyanide hydratase and apolipoprotein N-acyltransferase [Colwellia psychrerythraea]